jgi:hypothetical protein
MAQLIKEVRVWIDEQTAFNAILRRHDLPALTDDVAVPWATDGARNLHLSATSMQFLPRKASPSTQA